MDRYATTRSINVVDSTTISFDLIYGDGLNGGEKLDLAAGEEVVLEYSTNNGSSWTELNRYDTVGLTNWTPIKEYLPKAAQTSSTLFRWRQLKHSRNNCDNWGLDNVVITCQSN